MEHSLNQKYDLAVITGPTASGKTALAAAVAARIGGEVISADSRQVYRRMNIGTGKDYNDYIVEGKRIPCHLIDLADPGVKYNVFEYQHDFLTVYKSLKKRNILPVVCGGSGMYLDSIVSGYRMLEVPPDHDLRSQLEEKSISELAARLASYKKLHNVTDIDTKKRAIRAIEIEEYHLKAGRKQTLMPELRSLVVGIMLDRAARRERISKRLRQRLDNGMVDEIRQLLDEGLKPADLIYYGLEYKYITLYLIGDLTYDNMFSELETAIHRYAKRQMTWFRGMERRGIKINWIDGDLPLEKKANHVIQLLSD